MPTQNFSSKIGKSSSPTMERVIKNNTNVQQPTGSVQQTLAKKFTKSPVKI
jgi:hypothetical protein